MVGILSLPFVLALRSSVSPFQKNRGFSSGQIFANFQCLLKISAGLDFPSFQLNWRYPAAMASLTLWYDANVDFFRDTGTVDHRFVVTNHVAFGSHWDPKIHQCVSEIYDLICSISCCPKLRSICCSLNCSLSLGVPVGWCCIDNV